MVAFSFVKAGRNEFRALRRRCRILNCGQPIIFLRGVQRYTMTLIIGVTVRVRACCPYAEMPSLCSVAFWV